MFQKGSLKLKEKRNMHLDLWCIEKSYIFGRMWALLEFSYWRKHSIIKISNIHGYSFGKEAKI